MPFNQKIIHHHYNTLIEIKKFWNNLKILKVENKKD